MSIPQRQRQEVFYCSPGYQSEYTLFHTTRIIKYVFLDGSQNVVPLSQASSGFESQLGYLESSKGYYYPLVIPDHSLANSFWPPDFGRLPIFVTLSKGQEKLNAGWGRPLFSRDRLPVFRQLCGEGVLLTSHNRENKVGLKPSKDEWEKTEDATAQELGGNIDGEEEEEEEEEDKEEEEEEEEEEEGEEEEEEEEKEDRSCMPQNNCPGKGS